jgi:8-oxo-dGTP pyrophosphatase MutT (NUDIX family)
MWAFPGGRVDPLDGGDDEIARAANAAARETWEEIRIRVDPERFVTLAHWLPPAIRVRRFSTWFFIADVSGAELTPEVDGIEIVEARWSSPAGALAAALPMAPPTIVTLHTLHEAGSVRGLYDLLTTRGVERFATHLVSGEGGDIALWPGDAGYETGDPGLPGPRHRMALRPGQPALYERSPG